MKWLSAGLTFVNFATISGLLLGMIFRGLGPSIAGVSLMLGAVAAVAAFFQTADAGNQPAPSAPSAQKTSRTGYRSVWLWLLAACFVMFAVRSFCWLLYYDAEELRIQSNNNLGDLALHITYIKNFANGVSLWPDNPIYVFSKLRYPAGVDLFNALLYCVQVDLTRGLIWTGLFASLATFYAFYRWGGAFGVAGFLFNGGLAGFEFIKIRVWIDYQSEGIAWKSIPLAMFVTQRGLLYAIPAGLLLLWYWREKFFRASEQDRPFTALPFWIELALYASMPLFHLHTFMALSVVLLFLFALGDAPMRKHTAKLVASAFLPAAFFVWLITDHFHAGSILGWHPGWVQGDADFIRPFSHSSTDFGILNPLVNFLEFWPMNFGLWIPMVLALIGVCSLRIWKTGIRWGNKLPEEVAFPGAAAAIFLFAFFVKTAPWEWDNIKVIIWAYFLVLPLLWSDLIARYSLATRTAFCIVLFFSGFVSLFGGLAAGRSGYEFANRAEVDLIGVAIRKLPVEARFAAYPTYNHPLLLNGRKLVLGYPGHLWTQGFDYSDDYKQLGELMQGEGDWRAIARHLGVRYIFWGREEQINYPISKRPWERTAQKVNYGNWGTIYDLESANPSPAPANSPH
jgi:hypothetical protein